MIITKQCEIWSVNFDPQIGKEIKKTRPAVIIDDDFLARTQMRFIVPLTTWQPKFDILEWLIQIDPNNTNGLNNKSAFNVLQSKYASTERFINKIGVIDNDTLINIQKMLIKFINPNIKISM